MIAVTGTTGQVGRQVVQRPSGTGVPFRAVVRDAALEAARRPGVKHVVRASALGAMEGSPRA